MNYRYTLIVGLLVSAHILMGSEKDIWAINNVPNDPPYEKYEEIKNILKTYAIDSTQKKWQISVVPDKGNAGKICLGYYESITSNRVTIVCGGDNTEIIRDLPHRCNDKVRSLNNKIQNLNTLLKPQEMDYASRAIEICCGIFFVSVAGISLKKFLSTGKNLSMLLHASASFGIGSIG